MKCKCGEKATYVGAVHMECSNSMCENYTPPREKYYSVNDVGKEVLLEDFMEFTTGRIRKVSEEDPTIAYIEIAGNRELVPMKRSKVFF